MDKNPFIFGNWKMNQTSIEGVNYAESLRDRLRNREDIICGICPPFVFLKDICTVLEGSNINVAAQNIHSEKYGAFTGEVSAPMVKESGCSHVLIGHSERRYIFLENDTFINAKIKTALQCELTPVLCVGETLEEREGGKTNEIIKNQIDRGLEGIDAEQARCFIVAYEPVWAIGTGRTAKPQQANDVHKFIRKILTGKYSMDLAENTYILYGGSAKPDNAKDLMVQPEIDGLLVGGASLKLEPFLEIIDASS